MVSSIVLVLIVIFVPIVLARMLGGIMGRKKAVLIGGSVFPVLALVIGVFDRFLVNLNVIISHQDSAFMQEMQWAYFVFLLPVWWLVSLFFAFVATLPKRMK